MSRQKCVQALNNRFDPFEPLEAPDKQNWPVAGRVGIFAVGDERVSDDRDILRQGAAKPGGIDDRLRRGRQPVRQMDRGKFESRERIGEGEAPAEPAIRDAISPSGSAA